jgi:peroxiredoxin Q/BCP
MSEVADLEIGQIAPLFSSTDSTGTTHDLAELNSQGKTVILYFYPKDNTPGCTKQACDFRDQMASLSSADVVVLGVSKDSGKSHEKFTGKYDLNFPLLLDEELELHNSYGTWREKKNYGLTYMGCARSTFIINPDGILAQAMYNVKATGHVARIMKLLDL